MEILYAAKSIESHVLYIGEKEIPDMKLYICHSANSETQPILRDLFIPLIVYVVLTFSVRASAMSTHEQILFDDWWTILCDAYCAWARAKLSSYKSSLGI